MKGPAAAIRQCATSGIILTNCYSATLAPLAFTGPAKVAFCAKVTVKLLPVEKSTNKTPELAIVLIVPNDCLLTITVPLSTPPVLSYLLSRELNAALPLDKAVAPTTNAALPEACAVSAALIPALPEAKAVVPTTNAALPDASAVIPVLIPAFPLA